MEFSKYIPGTAAFRERKIQADIDDETAVMAMNFSSGCEMDLEPDEDVVARVEEWLGATGLAGEMADEIKDELDWKLAQGPTYDGRLLLIGFDDPDSIDIKYL